MFSQAQVSAKKRRMDTERSVSAGSSSDYENRQVLVVGYSPTGGGHTARTLNIVTEAVSQGSLKQGDLVIFYVPPHWEGTKRPQLLADLSKKLLDNQIAVKFVESEKPVYGYLDKKTGGSDDASILERIALHPLRNALRSDNNAFLSTYFVAKELQSNFSGIKAYQPEHDIDNLQRMSANTLMSNLIQTYGSDNIKILSDMDPALQKAASNHGIGSHNRLDQQNHAILLNREVMSANLEMKKAVLGKVLGGRGENISHIGLGGKNTLKGTLSILSEFSITENSTLAEVKKKLSDAVLSYAMTASEAEQKFASGNYSGVVKGKSVTRADSVHKTIYIYAHKKTPIIARHVLSRINEDDSDYNNKMFIFCGPGAVGKLNAMHVAYLMDADGITTSGAGTSGEFVYLHKVAGARSNLLSLPIEGHNEQEAITDALLNYPSTKNNTLKLDAGERLEDGHTIDRLVRKEADTANDHVVTYKRFISALSDSETYVGQAHDILFKNKALDEEASEYLSIQRAMYSNANQKGSRRYLKLLFQMFNYLTTSSDTFPMTIKFKEASSDITFQNIDEIKAFLSNPHAIAEKFGLTDSQAAESLPLIQYVRDIMAFSDNFNSDAGRDIFIKLKDKLGHHMTTGF